MDALTTWAGDRDDEITYNYTAVLNIVFATIAEAILIIVFFRSGGPAMMRMVASGGHAHDGHCHAGHDAHHGH